MLSLTAFGLFASAYAADTQLYTHSWDTVGDVIGMHGKTSNFETLPDAETLKFIAENYPLTTSGSGCPKNGTIEEGMLAFGEAIKGYNSETKVGMYWRTDMALEVPKCSAGAKEWADHASDWSLKDDQGNPVDKHGSAMFDYSNPEFCAFFTNLLLDLLKPTVSKDVPTIDYIYFDGPGGSPTEFADGIGPERSAQILQDKMNFFTNFQESLNAKGLGQNCFLNGVDDVDAAQRLATTGASGVMFDHWSILQFLFRGPVPNEGQFNTTLMNEAFELVTSDVLSNVSVLVKGWPGPIVKQKDEYPSNLPQPATPEDYQQIAGDRFNNELALFLLVAEDKDWWQYSWFWGFDDWVPNQPDSTVPSDFFPETKCQLGAPKGKYTTKDQIVFTRNFEYATVTVNLNNRTDSKVTFLGKC